MATWGGCWLHKSGTATRVSPTLSLIVFRLGLWNVSWTLVATWGGCWLQKMRYSHQIFFKFVPHNFQAWFVKYKLNVGGGFVGGCCLHNTVVQPPDLLQLYPSSFPGLVCEMLDERWWLSEEGADTTREWSSHQSFFNVVPHHFQAWFGTYKLDSVPSYVRRTLIILDSGPAKIASLTLCWLNLWESQ